ncbi:hypothetical protein C8F01DRAFT_746225 [Mycena amicta]|nr:hypothetical protein C8F01DRAFT_746225 [Mycena amicta]
MSRSTPTATYVLEAMSCHREAHETLTNARQAERDTRERLGANTIGYLAAASGAPDADAFAALALAAANTACDASGQAILAAETAVVYVDKALSAILVATNAILLPQIQELARNSGLPGFLVEDQNELLESLHLPTFAQAADLAERFGFTLRSLTDPRSVWRTHHGRSQGTRSANSEDITRLAASTTFLDAANIIEDLSDEDFEMAYGFWKLRRRVASPPSYEVAIRSDGALQMASETGSVGHGVGLDHTNLNGAGAATNPSRPTRSVEMGR